MDRYWRVNDWRARVLEHFATLLHCVIGIEACASAHFWAREIGTLGHMVRLIPPSYVKPYVKRQKNDRANAEAICEAVARPNMRFVPIKSTEQQDIMVLHRTRSPLMRQRVQLSNAIRGHVAEFGIVAPIGRTGLLRLMEIVQAPSDTRIPGLARASLLMMVAQLRLVNTQILENDRRIIAAARSTPLGKRLMEIPGVGPVLAGAVLASVPDPKSFRSGRNLATWIGLVPRQNSSGGKERLGSITKQGDRYLRKLLVVGAVAVIRFAQRHGARRPWLVKLLERRKPKVAAVALANKTARTVWAIMTSGERYRDPKAA